MYKNLFALDTLGRHLDDLFIFNHLVEVSHPEQLRGQLLWVEKDFEDVNVVGSNAGPGFLGVFFASRVGVDVRQKATNCVQVKVLIYIMAGIYLSKPQNSTC